MHTIIHSLTPSRPTHGFSPATIADYREPNYEFSDQAAEMKLVVFVPGVDAAGIDIEATGADLTVTAKKAHFVRVNWHALHLESAQRDYRLRLRLGNGFNYEAMQAEITHGVLTVTLPKRVHATVRSRRVA